MRGGAVVIEQARAGVEAGFHRDVVHVLDAAGDLHVLAVGGDALGGLVDRLQAGAAQLRLTVTPPTSMGRPAIRRGHAGDVEALLALLLDAAPLDVLDLPTPGTPTRSSRAVMRSADRSSARTSR